MADLDVLYTDIESYLQDLEKNYLSKHIATKTATPDDYSNDVKSYCVLSHATFEEFMETIAITLMHKTVDDFIMHHKITESLVALMHFKSNGEGYLVKENADVNQTNTSYDYIRLRLLEIKGRFSKEVFNNHGISLKYLKQLLLPLAIDISTDPTMMNSLGVLARERGSYAHRFLEKGTIKKSIAPEDAKIIVDDCFKLCFDVKEKVKVRMK